MKRRGLVRHGLVVACVAFAAAGAQVALAASAPSATTGSAQAVSTTSATLTGTVNPQGSATTYHFEYGTTTAYGTSTASSSAGNGTSNVSASAAIASLTPNTTYHYRLVATNGTGTTPGDDATLTTGKRPPLATTGSPKSVSTTAATLTGELNPEGQPTTYYFEYGRTASYGSHTPQLGAGSGSSGVNVSAAIGSLAPATLYHYRLVAVNGSGTTHGADKTVTTAKPPPPPPTVSTGGVKAVTETSATLTGAVNPQGSATSYFFQYGTTTAYGGHTRRTSAGSGTRPRSVEAAIGGLSPGTLYHYRLVAVNGPGTALGDDRTFVAARPSRVTLGAAPGTIVIGQSTTLSGTVVTTKRARITVTLQRSSSAFGPFTTFATTTTAPGGTFSFGPYRFGLSSWFRVLAGGVNSAPVHVGVRYRMSLFASHMRPRPGQVVRFHGTVIPPRNGHRVALQRFGADRRWHTLRLPRLRRLGNVSTYSVSLPIRRSGLWRVLIGPGPRHARGFSRVLSIRLS